METGDCVGGGGKRLNPDTACGQFQAIFGQFFENENVFLFSKGRACLYAILRACGMKSADEVLIPGYTCVVVPSAVINAGAIPRYVDIDPRTFNLSLDSIQKAVNSHTKMLLVQHTYGIPCELDAIREWAREKRIAVVEDCCHAVGSRYGEGLCGTWGCASFFSGQWNKPFTTGLGGMLLVRDEPLAKAVAQVIEREIVRPGWTFDMTIRLQTQIYEILSSPRMVPLLTVIYRFLSNYGVMVGSSDACELKGQIPKRYFMEMSRAQARKGIVEMKALQENLDHRTRIAAYYQDQLSSAGIPVYEPADKEHPVFVRYPVRVEKKAELLEMAFRQGIEIGSWFESPLHPIQTGLEQFGYVRGSCPEAEKASQQAINLPTHRKITMTEAERIIQFLRKSAQFIDR